MSIPRRDPNFTMADLEAAAAKFLDAGKEYWEAMAKSGIGGALAWIEDGNKGLVIFTRGEYREILLRNIPEVGPVIHFGSARDETYK